MHRILFCMHFWRCSPRISARGRTWLVCDWTRPAYCILFCMHFWQCPPRIRISARGRTWLVCDWTGPALWGGGRGLSSLLGLNALAVRIPKIEISTMRSWIFVVMHFDLIVSVHAALVVVALATRAMSPCPLYIYLPGEDGCLFICQVNVYGCPDVTLGWLHEKDQLSIYLQ